MRGMSYPRAATISRASASGMRGNGMAGTCTSRPNSSSISAPCLSLTAWIANCRSSSCIVATSSCESIQLISASMLVNSVACLLVNDGSARYTSPISKILPKPADCAICLKNCGLCAR